MLMLYWRREWRPAGLAAFLLLGLAGGGVAMTLGAEVERKQQKWGWLGLMKALRRPSKEFWRGFLGHLPQFLLAVYLAYSWWRRETPQETLVAQNNAT